MTGLELAIVVIGSGGTAAVINVLANWFTKRGEWRRQDEAFALKLTEIKLQQMMAVQEWVIKDTGRPGQVDLWDPLASAIEYLRGLEEYRRSGRWGKADRSVRERKSN